MFETVNLPLVLVVGTALTGIIWLIDRLFFRARRMEAAGNEPMLVEYARSFFPVLLVVLVLRSFVFEPFRIPSGSMIPTLLVGDFILVSKYSYGLRLPVLNTEILNTGRPQRGDVAVFRYPRNPNQDYIKRVVGLPGDEISYDGRQFVINGELMPVTGDETYVSPITDAPVAGVSLREEDLSGVEHPVLEEGRGGVIGPGSLVVPDGHYFMVGDNRDRSSDSRTWGFVPEENLVGKAKWIWMHWNGGPRFSRVGTSIN